MLPSLLRVWVRDGISGGYVNRCVQNQHGERCDSGEYWRQGFPALFLRISKPRFCGESFPASAPISTTLHFLSVIKTSDWPATVTSRFTGGLAHRTTHN
jgi:hypothetical protein